MYRLISLLCLCILPGFSNSGDTQISVYIHVSFGHAVFQKAFWDKQCNFWSVFNVHMQPGQCFLQSPIFCESDNIWNLHHFVSIFWSVLFRVLKIKINLVKLTFWTAISSHQVMGMSLTKVWVMENIPRWIWSFSCIWLAENKRKWAGHGLKDEIQLKLVSRS